MTLNEEKRVPHESSVWLFVIFKANKTGNVLIKCVAAVSNNGLMSISSLNLLCREMH